MSKEVSLKEFIDKNYQMLTVMGVLGAIITFFTRIEGYEGLEPLITWSFLAFLLINWELWKTFNKISEPSWILIFFGSCLIGIFLGVSGYVVSNYWRQVLPLAITTLSAISIFYLLFRFRFEQIEAHERMYKWMAMILLFVLWLFVYAIFNPAETPQ